MAPSGEAAEALDAKMGELRAVLEDEIEQRMREIVNKKHTITRRMVPRADAIQMFHDRDEPYKVDIIERAIAVAV